MAGLVSHVVAVSEQSSAVHEEYRADIDGLRAIAVLAVLGFHAAPDLVPGGFAGVDIFFVISGYLISGIILRAMERGRFSYLDFYACRVRRIFPALIAMLLAVLMLSWPVFLWDEYRLLGKHIVAGACFISNLTLYQELNWYFGTTTTPLVHLWSLGVEEQFYILWPIFLMAAWRLGRYWPIAIAIAAAASFAANVTTVSSDPMAAFYLPSSRLWELCTGAALAAANLQRSGAASCNTGYDRPAAPEQRWMPGPSLRGLIGALLIAASLVGLDSNLAFPGWWALAPCAGTLLLISAGPRGWINRHLLARSPMVFVGLVSYPLYLWHWPLLSIVHVVKGNQLAWPVALGTLSVAFALALLTYRYIELPVRSSRSKGLTAIVGCALMVACAGLGFLAFIQKIPARPAPQEVDRLIRASGEDWLTGAGRSWTLETDGFLTLGSGSRRVLFVGDSNMQQYYPRVEKLLAEHPSNGRSAVFAVMASCAPAVVDLVEYAHFTVACRTLLRNALEYAKDPQVDTIVIGAYWYVYLAADWRPCCPGPLKPAADAVLQDLKRTIADFVSRGKRVYVVLNIPVGPDLDPRRAIRTCQIFCVLRRIDFSSLD